MKLDTFPVRQWGDMGDTEAPHLCLQNNGTVHPSL